MSMAYPGVFLPSSRRSYPALGEDDYLAIIDRHFGYPKEDHRGERWPACPFHTDRTPGSFSYSERGFSCFSCGAKGSLRRLAGQLGLSDSRPVPILRPQTRPQNTNRPAAWTHDPDYWRRFIPLPRIAADYAHSRGVSDESIERWRIGCGILPASRCHHPRLILPVFDGGRLVGLRGRQMGCPCPPKDKWLQSAGSKTVLFGAETIQTRQTIIVTEAPLSAILANQEAAGIARVVGGETCAVAGTAGAACWRPEWTERIAQSRPVRVIVFFDNDEAGQTSGIKVVNELLVAGVRATLYRWPASAQPKADLADVVVEWFHAA